MDTSNGDEASAKPPTPAETTSAAPTATDAATTAPATTTPTQETNGEVHADEKPQQPTAPPVKELTEEEKKALANREKIPNGNIKTAAAAAISAAAVKAKVKQLTFKIWEAEKCNILS